MLKVEETSHEKLWKHNCTIVGKLGWTLGAEGVYGNKAHNETIDTSKWFLCNMERSGMVFRII